MSERKVLNKYYPPDFDPSKIPKRKQARNHVFNIRIMAPFNMRCNTCGEYIYKGKKFNSRKENVDNEDFLGLRIFRFYIKCPRCVSEIAFKTDLERTDYALEAGATRLFEAERLAQEMAEKERKEKEEDELNPMKLLENRTKASQFEIEQIDALEELKEINSKKSQIDHESMIKMHQAYEEHLQRLQEEQEENEIRAIFGDKNEEAVKRLHDDSDSELEEPSIKKINTVVEKPTDIFVQEKKEPAPKKTQVWQKSVGGFSSKQSLASLVKKKSSSTTDKSSLEKEPDSKLLLARQDSNKPSPSKDYSNKSSPWWSSLVSSALSKKEPSEIKQTPSCLSGSLEMKGRVSSISVKASKSLDAANIAKPSVATGLGLLGSYSDSSSNSDNGSDE
ncbi:hypothetical protein CHS0354_035431 [Potamilus streckersoni]|uniref:Splicing factor YJU2 n=1 Tax=Potamilus streckersoni TaxID=2493646 RepID=A0AAE0WCL9_9BIVA|nr:hypothetical protein CHS0354_035431 [Potamilus streckersoni]